MKYVSLLRGINVSGQKKIKMDELRILYENLGFSDVISYIQSGNVVFSTRKTDTELLKTRIEEAIEARYGFRVPVIMQTHADLLKIIRDCPFGVVDLQQDGTKVLVSFMSRKPTQKELDSVRAYASVSEKIESNGKVAYLYCPEGYGKSKLSNSFLEKKLDMVATTRNWKSVHRLFELSKT